MTHVTHNKSPIPPAKARESQVEAGKLRRKVLDKIDVNCEAACEKLDKVIHVDLSEANYLAALELMARYYEIIKNMLDKHPDETEQTGLLGLALKHSFNLAIEAKRKADEN